MNGVMIADSYESYAFVSVNNFICERNRPIFFFCFGRWTEGGERERMCAGVLLYTPMRLMGELFR